MLATFEFVSEVLRVWIAQVVVVLGSVSECVADVDSGVPPKLSKKFFFDENDIIMCNDSNTSTVSYTSMYSNRMISNKIKEGTKSNKEESPVVCTSVLQATACTDILASLPQPAPHTSV